MRRGFWAVVAALFGMALLLGACDGGTASSGDRTQATQATKTPTAVPSPTTPRISPRQTPDGWQIYVGPHFALAYPPGWTAQAFPQGNSTESRPVVVYGFSS